MKTGVYVGSFNPIHKGHEKVVEYLLDNKFLDRILVVPTMEYWDKQNLVSLDKRIDMIRLAFNDRVIVKSYENKEFTYQILDSVHEEFNDDDIYLIIGADNVKDFDKWKNVQDILKYNVIVLNRDNIEVNFDKSLNKDKFLVIKDYPFVHVSSTVIRELIKCKKYYELSMVVSENVIKYIIDNKLYLEG